MTEKLFMKLNSFEHYFILTPILTYKKLSPYLFVNFIYIKFKYNFLF